MIDRYKIITITHHDLNVNELEKFVVKNDVDALAQIKEALGIDELQYLSTCNRVTFLFYTDEVIDETYLAKFLIAVNADLATEKVSTLLKFVKVFEGALAVEHMFSIASSLDSLVIGEREILRQCKDSYIKSTALKLTGDNIRILSEYTIQTAKDVYSNTRIGEKPISIVSLAIQKLLGSNVKPTDRVLLIGAGETIELVSKFLQKHEFTNISIFNRSIDNAKKLSDFLQAKAFHLSELKTYSGGFDCIIACTGATDLIVTQQMYEALLRDDLDHKLVIDLAVPNNVARTIPRDHDVELVDIEALRELAEENMKFRQQEVGEASKIIKERVNSFTKVHQQRQIERALTDLPQEIEAVKKRAIEKVYSKELEKLDTDTKELIHEMMDYMQQKCVGIPMKIAKQAVMVED